MLTPNPRLLAVAIAVSAGLVVSARQQATVRITSPVDDAYVSGLMRLTAVIEPPAATRNVKEVIFFADAKKVCTVSRQPFQCDWDAGDRVVEHTIRVTAEMIKGERAAATVHTRGVKFAEAVDVDVVQLTAVVTDGGRFVSGLKAEDFKVYDNDRPQAITSFESENISLEMVAALDVSSSMRDALPRVKESAKRFLGGLRPGDHVTLLAFNDIVYTLTQRTRDQAARALAIDRMRAWGGTALYDVVVDALRRLERQTGRRSLAALQRRRRSVEPRDARGGDGARREQRRDHLRDRAGTRGHARAICRPCCIDSRKPAADASFFTEDVERLDKFFEEILEDLSNQYLISYSYPDAERDGQWHKVRLEAAGGKYEVRVRPGYRLNRN